MVKNSSSFKFDYLSEQTFEIVILKTVKDLSCKNTDPEHSEANKPANPANYSL